MKIKVEFYGLASQLCGTREVDINLREGATLEDVLVELSLKFPKLVGPIIDKNNNTLISNYIFSIGGKYIPESLKNRVYEGECILLMSELGGG